MVPFGGGVGGGDGPVVVITNSRVRHELSGSEYPQRVAQCEEAVAVIRKAEPRVRSLRDVTSELLALARPSLSDVAYRRALHNVTENERTLATVEALKKVLSLS